MSETSGEYGSRALAVTGQGRASADPDLTVLRFWVSAREKSYAAVNDRLNERVETLRSDLERAEIDRKQLKTMLFDIRKNTTTKKANVFFEGTSPPTACGWSFLWTENF